MAMTVNKRSDNLPHPPTSPAPRRGYHSPKRRQQADATRQRILVAAERLFAERGFATVTMEAIARAAHVSLATLYLHFSGRTAIVGTLAEALVAAPELSVEQVEREADPVKQLQIGAHVLRLLNERSWIVTDILRSQRGNDGELAELWALWQQRHLDATRRAMAALAKSGGLRPVLSVEIAADVFYALAGTEVYRALVQERRWSPEQYERWLFELACRELLAHEA
jgi:AcrR family transcriptional regulator